MTSATPVSGRGITGRVGGPGTPPFGARGMRSVRYGARLGDLEENWFLCFPIKHSTHTLGSGPMLAALAVSELPAALQ